MPGVKHVRTCKVEPRYFSNPPLPYSGNSLSRRKAHKLISDASMKVEASTQRDWRVDPTVGDVIVYKVGQGVTRMLRVVDVSRIGTARQDKVSVHDVAGFCRRSMSLASYQKIAKDARLIRAGDTCHEVRVD